MQVAVSFLLQTKQQPTWSAKKMDKMLSTLKKEKGT